MTEQANGSHVWNGRALRAASESVACRALAEIGRRVQDDRISAVETRDLVEIAKLATSKNQGVEDALDSLSVTELRELIAGLNAAAESRRPDESRISGVNDLLGPKADKF